MKRGLLIILTMASTGFWLRAQESEPLRFESPYDAIYNHLKYLQEDDYQPAKAAKSLYAGDGSNLSNNLSSEELEGLAIELKQILDGSGSYVELDDIPKSPNYYDSLSKKYKYVLFENYPDIYVQRYDQGWYFSGKSSGFSQ